MLDHAHSSSHLYDFNDYSDLSPEQQSAMLTKICQSGHYRRLTIRNCHVFNTEALEDLAEHSPGLLELNLLSCRKKVYDHRGWEVPGFIALSKKCLLLETLNVSGSDFTLFNAGYDNSFTTFQHDVLFFPNLVHLYLENCIHLECIYIEAPNLGLALRIVTFAAKFYPLKLENLLFYHHKMIVKRSFNIYLFHYKFPKFFECLYLNKVFPRELK